MHIKPAWCLSLAPDQGRRRRPRAFCIATNRVEPTQRWGGEADKSNSSPEARDISLENIAAFPLETLFLLRPIPLGSDLPSLAARMSLKTTQHHHIHIPLFRRRKEVVSITRSRRSVVRPFQCLIRQRRRTRKERKGRND